MKLWAKIAIGLVAGTSTGLILGENVSFLKPVGDVFLNAIKMLIVPLVFSSLVVGVTSLKDPRKLGRVGFKAFVAYLFTTVFAISIGLAFGHVLKPGAGMHLSPSETLAAPTQQSVVDTFVNIIPSNPLQALASGQILQIIMFALLFGISLVLIGEKAKPVSDFFEAIAEAMYKLTDMVMSLAPYGVFALMAWVGGSYGLAILLPLGKVIISVYLACVLHILVVYSLMLFVGGRLNPVRFFYGIKEALALSFSTSSSAATLPVSIREVQENLGVSKGVASFVLPLGATINMDGTAIYQGVTALFVAQAFGVDLSFAQMVTIVLTATLASIGTAGIPGAGLIMLSLILSSVGLPMEGLALVAGIDRILDMVRTSVNVTGDCMVATLVAKSEGELDLDVYATKSVS
jgi:Na+/H+-dicarboxylate symporter